MLKPSKSFILPLTIMALYPTMALAYGSKISDEDAAKLAGMSLEELSNIKVTSVSKREEPKDEAAAAIFVITQEDIKRSGATEIPELLRMAPGITVARSSSNNWTVSSRGFNDQFSNKLLVLIDGRTIYSPLFSGVIWDTHDLILSDIERIEVIRGPGATLWGANAVNGVINIITKNSKDTQGGLAQASFGNKSAIGSMRYGAKVGDIGYIRTYAKHSDYNSQYKAASGKADDSWRRQQAGFRSDLRLSVDNNLKIQGDIYNIDEDNFYNFPDMGAGTFHRSSKGFDLRGGNIIARWDGVINDDSEFYLQAYFDSAFQKTSFFSDIANTADLEFQHSWIGWDRQEITWGLGYRFINNDNEDSSAQYALTPHSRNDSLYSAFLQDKISLVTDKLYLTIGSKFEHNDYTGFEWQPSSRIAWLIDKDQTLWAAVSRAVHTPGRFNSDGRLSLVVLPTTPLPTLLSNQPDKNLDSENMISYEVGYRVKPIDDLYLDVTAYCNKYNNLYRGVFGAPTVVGGTYVSLPVSIEAINKATSVGFEASAKYQPLQIWYLSGSYSYIDLNFDDKSQIGLSFIGRNPKNMFNLQSTYIFPNRLEMTNMLYYTSELSSINIPGYYRFDTRLSYPITENIELNVVGQNLLDPRHKEFTQFLYQNPAEIGRNIYAGMSFKF
ncbi:MAG: TonB-dependent receptor [Rickettsiales bacterium]